MNLNCDSTDIELDCDSDIHPMNYVYPSGYIQREKNSPYINIFPLTQKVDYK